MTSIRDATETRASYENFFARCPWCEVENVFNRKTDLGDVQPIARKEVHCLNPSCGKLFAITGDSVNSAHEMLIFDCYELKKEKRYCYCVLNLAQAFEVFFSLYLRVLLLCRPFAWHEREDTGEDNLVQLNALASELYEAIKDHAFAKLRNVFLNCVLTYQNIASFDEAATIIRTLPALNHMPSDQALSACGNPKLTALLKLVKDSKVGELRNKIVHQRAYRPTLAEVELALQETRSIIFPLSHLLSVQGDDINWYMRRA